MRKPLLPHALVTMLAVLPAMLALPDFVAAPLHAETLLGWLGSGLLAVSLLLMVREPALTQWFGGLEHMYRWHHLLGTLGYVALLVHPLAVALPALRNDPTAAWRALTPIMQPWHQVIGWIALMMLMAGLGTTFAVKLRYSL